MTEKTQNIVKQADEFLKKTSDVVKDLPKEVLTGQFDTDIMKLEDIFDERYPELDRAQDLEDFKDDLQQPGFVGVGLVKGKDENRELVGYLYGYRFIYGDNWDEESFDEASWYVADKDKEREELRSAAKSGKIVYMSNLSIAPMYRFKLLAMLHEVIGQIKEQGYRYCAMDMLEDSFKLLMGFGGKPNFGRLNKFGFDLIMTTGDYASGSLVILKVK
jgi:hypothetical protein